MDDLRSPQGEPAVTGPDYEGMRVVETILMMRVMKV
jgi:hypothetical protein